MDAARQCAAVGFTGGYTGLSVKVTGKVAAAAVALATSVFVLCAMFGIVGPADTASAAAAYTWYFAEGYTGAGFQEYICIANPTSAGAEVSVEFLFAGGGSKQAVVSVAPMSRSTLDVNTAAGAGKEVSARMTSTCADLVMERPIYFNYQGKWAGSHCVFAAQQTATEWYFAEGYTGGGFDEYICVLNPSPATADLTFMFQTAGSGEIVRSGSVAARSRATFKVNDILGQGIEASFRVRSSVPVVAERPMYFDYQSRSGARWQGGHCVMGAVSLAPNWSFAEGTTRQGFDEWLTLQNPGESAMKIQAVYQTGAGQGLNVEKTYSLGAKRRLTISVTDEVGPEKDVSVLLTSPGAFLTERPMYYHFEHSGLTFEGANCSIGSDPQGTRTFFAEGYTGSFFEEWLCVQNTSASEATIEIDYLTQECGALSPRAITVPARSRETVFVNESAGRDFQLAARVRTVRGSGVVVERAMYFDRTRWAMPIPDFQTVGVPGPLYGLCFSPYLQADPFSGASIGSSTLSGLIETMGRYSGWIRTFGSQGEWSLMPSMAHAVGMQIAGGCDIYTDLQRNAAEAGALASQAAGGQIDMAVVGDEVLLGNALTEQQLIGYIRQVRATGVPTGTSDAWTEWLSHPNLIAECDVILMNIYPYWEGLRVEDSVAHVADCYARVKALAGARPVIVETGWPTDGEVKGSAVASQANAARYLRDFMAWAQQGGVPYFFFEAFDESWKASREGDCGDHWGLWDSSAVLKPEMATVIAPRP